jgi:hypothetical protein
MKWCNILNMFCDDIEEEEKEFIQCDGDCKNCEECSGI